MDVLLELMVSQVILVEWRDDKALKQKRAFNFLFEKFKTFYMPVFKPHQFLPFSLLYPSPPGNLSGLQLAHVFVQTEP